MLTLTDNDFPLLHNGFGIVLRRDGSVVASVPFHHVAEEITNRMNREWLSRTQPRRSGGDVIGHLALVEKPNGSVEFHAVGNGEHMGMDWRR